MSLVHQLFLQSLRESKELATERFDAWRGPVIAGLLEHMAWQVPSYRTVFSRMAAGESFDLSRWTELPILRSEDVDRLSSALRAERLPPRAQDLIDVAVGAQRRPLLRSRVAQTALECERELIYENNQLDLSAPLAVLHSDDAGKGTEGMGWSITFPKSRWVSGDVFANAADQRRWLAGTGAKILRTDANLALGLARAQRRDDRLMLDAVILTDKNLASAARDEIAAAFSAPVIRIIEHSLLGPVAASDPVGGFSVPAGTAIVEIVGSSGRPVSNGETGEILLTPLYEYAFPLLRLATGVLARAGAEQTTNLGIRKLDSVGSET
jgi:phenylacetate-CoA ligase